MTRRDFLAAAGCATVQPARASSLIFIELAGGASQSDTFDLETGPWTPAWMDPATIGGTRFPAGAMPRLAGLLDRVTLVREIEAPGLGHRGIHLGCDPVYASAGSFEEVCRRALVRVLGGDRLVHIRFGSWDHHGNLYPQLSEMTRSFDAGVASLVRSEPDAWIVAMGDFGRKPGPLNQNGGRDHHWRHAGLLAGPGLVPARIIRGVRNEDILRRIESRRS